MESKDKIENSDHEFFRHVIMSWLKPALEKKKGGTKKYMLHISAHTHTYQHICAPYIYIFYILISIVANWSVVTFTLNWRNWTERMIMCAPMCAGIMQIARVLSLSWLLHFFYFGGDDQTRWRWWWWWCKKIYFIYKLYFFGLRSVTWIVTLTGQFTFRQLLQPRSTQHPHSIIGFKGTFFSSAKKKSLYGIMIPN